MISLAFGLTGYVSAFMLALWHDRPFGPVPVALLLIVATVFLGVANPA